MTGNSEIYKLITIAISSKYNNHADTIEDGRNYMEPLC